MAMLIGTEVALTANRPLTDEEGREKAKATVRGVAKLGPNDFLNTRRREELEDYLFYHQMKIKGRIAWPAYFYEVYSGGWNIQSPDEAIISIPEHLRWYVAVSLSSDAVYRLYGFPDSEAEFQRMVTDIPVRVTDEGQAELWALFFLEVAKEHSRLNLIYDAVGLRQRLESHFIDDERSYEKRRKVADRVWRRFRNAFPRLELAPAARAAEDGYVVTVHKLAWGRVPELSEQDRWVRLQQLTMDVRKDGACHLIETKTLYTFRP